MRQIPHYLIIGNGRVARHFHHYFSLLTLPVSTWNRSESIDALTTKISNATHVLVLIKDDAIASFFDQHSANKNNIIWLHFSGSLVSPTVVGAHPLMTFSHALYDLAHYKKIPFVLDHDAPDFEIILPGLSNPHVRLSKKLKAKYHALCVLSGNFSCMLWKKLFAEFEKEFNFSSMVSHPYLLQQTQNLMSDPNSALTGPLTRNDMITIEKNLHALEGDPFQNIYKEFVACYQKIHGEKPL